MAPRVCMPQAHCPYCPAPRLPSAPLGGPGPESQAAYFMQLPELVLVGAPLHCQKASRVPYKLSTFMSVSLVYVRHREQCEKTTPGTAVLPAGPPAPTVSQRPARRVSSSYRARACIVPEHIPRRTQPHCVPVVTSVACCQGPWSVQSCVGDGEAACISNPAPGQPREWMREGGREDYGPVGGDHGPWVCWDSTWGFHGVSQGQTQVLDTETAEPVGPGARQHLWQIDGDRPSRTGSCPEEVSDIPSRDQRVRAHGRGRGSGLHWVLPRAELSQCCFLPCSCICGFPSTGTQRPSASLLCGLPGPQAAVFAHVLPTPGLMSVPTCTYFLWAFPAGRVLLCPACRISLVLRCALSLPLSVHEMGCILPWVGDMAPLVALVSPHKRTAICDDSQPPDALPPIPGPSAPSETTTCPVPGMRTQWGSEARPPFTVWPLQSCWRGWC